MHLQELARPESLIGKHDIEIGEGRYIVRTIKEQWDLEKAYGLRYKIFAEELKWVPEQDAKIEIDNYDQQAISFGVFNEDDALSAYMRLILASEPFMMEREFKFLVDPSHKIRTLSDTAEVSRLCIAPDRRNDNISGNFGVHSITIFLLKGVYQWCMLNNIRFLYAVTEERVFRLFRAKGFPFVPIGRPHQMPDGVVAMALMMDWDNFITENSRKRPRFFNWIQSSSTIPESMAIATA